MLQSIKNNAGKIGQVLWQNCMQVFLKTNCTYAGLCKQRGYEHMGIVRWAMAAEHECSKSELRSKLEWSTIYTAKIGLFYSCVVTSASYLNHYSTYTTD